MGMTKDEKMAVAYAKKDTGPFSSRYGVNKLVEIIARLEAENEELKDGRDYFYEELKEAQAKLDAIKKAWGATMDKASDDVFDALDKLIGGDK